MSKRSRLYLTSQSVSYPLLTLAARMYMPQAAHLPTRLGNSAQPWLVCGRPRITYLTDPSARQAKPASREASELHRRTTRQLQPA
jgi:hypothetical protein